MSDPYAMVESQLREQLAALVREFQERAMPIVKRLADIEALKPPQPIFICADELPPGMLKELQRFLVPKWPDEGAEQEKSITTQDNGRAWPKADNE